MSTETDVMVCPAAGGGPVGIMSNAVTAVASKSSAKNLISKDVRRKRNWS